MYSKDERTSLADEAIVISKSTPSCQQYTAIDPVKYKEKSHKIALEKTTTKRTDKIEATDAKDFGEPVKAYKYAY